MALVGVGSVYGSEDVFNAIYEFDPPVLSIQLVPVPVDDKSCPDVPTLLNESVNVDCNVRLFVNISEPCEKG